VPEFYKPTFEKLTGAKINVVAIPTELLHEKIMADLVSGKGEYDIMAAYFGWGKAYTPYLYDLRELFEEFGFDIRAYHPFCLMPNILGLDGKLYGFVSDADIWCFTARMNILRKVGIDKLPQTWEEVLAACEALMPLKEKEGIYPFVAVYNAMGFPCAMSFFDIALQWEDFKILKGDGSWEPDFLGSSGGGREALMVYKKLIEFSPPGALSYIYADARDDIWLPGKAAMTVGWTCLPHLAHYPDISKISPYFTDNIIAVGRVPKGTTQRSPGIWPCTAAAINKASRNPELAFLYTVFMLSQESMTVLALGSPSENHVGFKEVLADKRTWRLSPGWEITWKYGWSAAMSPFCFLPESYEIAEAVGTEIHRYLRGEITDPDEALKNAEKAARTILERGGYLGPRAPEVPPLTLDEWCKKVGLENPKPI
jgi:multiple sugar transport system substrate-binding protein